MASVPSELAVLVVMALIAVPAATYGTATYDRADRPEGADVPAVKTEDGTAPPIPDTPDPETLTYQGQIVVGDPSGEAFGPEGTFWEQSCQSFPFQPEGHTNTTLNLTTSPTDGRTEDLDLYFWDDEGTLLDKLDGPSKGIGQHHAGLIPESTMSFSVCLAEGVQGRFLVVMV